MIDLPPHIEQAIIAKAQQQGLTVQEMLAKDYADDAMWLELDKHGLNADDTPIIIDEHNAPIIQQLLDNPAPPTPLMRELLALGESMVKEKKDHV